MSSLKLGTLFPPTEECIEEFADLFYLSILRLKSLSLALPPAVDVEEQVEGGIVAAPKGPQEGLKSARGGVIAQGEPLKVGTLGTFLALKLTEGIVPKCFNALPIVVERTRYMVRLPLNPTLAPAGRTPILTLEGLILKQTKQDIRLFIGTRPLHVSDIVPRKQGRCTQ